LGVYGRSFAIGFSGNFLISAGIKAIRHCVDLVQYLTDLISTAGFYSGCVYPASTNLISFTGHYLCLTLPGKKMSTKQQRDSIACQSENGREERFSSYVVGRFKLGGFSSS